MLKIKCSRRAFFSLGLSGLIIPLGLVIHHQMHDPSKNSQSNYEIYIKSSLNQPNYYPIKLINSSSLYQPIGGWMGRLIFPAREQRQPGGGVRLEVYQANAAHQKLVGKIVNLRWSSDPDVQEFVGATTRDVNFTEVAEKSQQAGNLHPERLNQLNTVNPLESLAGARSKDDVIVILENPAVITRDQGEETSLVIQKEPVQITGRIYSLVTLIKRETKDKDRFIVRHFNKTTKQFDGPLEIIRIPEVPADIHGIRRSTNHDLENSPLNPAGWYIYGVKDAEGMFITQAIEPRALMQLKPDESRLTQKSALAYLNQEIWKNTEAQKGTAKTVLVHSAEQSSANPIWREGDRAIVMHLFGGIGGEKAEPAPLGLVTGHFAYGIARVVREPLSDELRFDIEYQQIYAHNPDGIVAGRLKWSSYMGDLQRGWLGNRPVADVIVKLDAVTEDYDFDGIQLSPMDEFRHQLGIMMALYRVGDGSGASVVNSAVSCVQDANQALYVTLKQIEDKVQSNPQIQDWLRRHPHHPQTLRFQQLVKLGKALEKQLVPLGIVRSDWQRNAENLAGTRSADGVIGTLAKTAISWRTMLPRRAHDELLNILLKHGATLWVIRTNQVGGYDPEITPRAPTALLGHRTK